MCARNTTESAWWKSVIVLTARFYIDSLIADFQLSFRTKNTPTDGEKFLGHFSERTSASKLVTYTVTTADARVRAFAAYSAVIEIE